MQLPNQITDAEAAGLMAILAPLKPRLADLEGNIDNIEDAARVLADLTAASNQAETLRDAIDADTHGAEHAQAEDLAAHQEGLLSEEQTAAALHALHALRALEALKTEVDAALAAFRAALAAAAAAEQTKDAA
jgi:hypothetical protein